MCEQCVDITDELGATVGCVLRVCPDFSGHLIAVLRQVAEARNRQDLIELTDPLGDTELLERCLTSQEPVTHVVVEWDYFDLDYRSEFTLLHETSFAKRSPQALRLTFFDGDARALTSEPLSPYRAVDELKNCFLGYIVLRPQHPGMIGRSLLRPRHTRIATADGTPLDTRVRTAVSEVVTIFGVALECSGVVPFMEQDGHLLRCGHVSAWICHYTATLKGLVARRPTGQFHEADRAWAVFNRPYPSAGLAHLSVGPMLNRLDLPPETRFGDEMGLTRQVRWHDRQEVRRWALGERLIAIMTNSSTRPREVQRAWLREDLTALVCRYMNSGVPVIIGIEDHTMVACGYLRYEHLSDNPDDHPTSLRRAVEKLGQPARDPSEVVSFLVQDDQEGPYRLLMVDDLVDLLSGDFLGTFSFFVPLPRGLWLAGHEAERWGAHLLYKHAHERLANFDSWVERFEPVDAAGRGDALKRLVMGMDQALEGDGPAPYAVRSYALTGSDLKRTLIERLGADLGPTAIGLARLPKYVWVVEAVLRGARGPGQPAVVATVVLDGSANVDSDSDGAIHELIMHLPGMITSNGLTDAETWLPASSDVYPSGRWDSNNRQLTGVRASAARSKGAAPASA